MPDRSIRNITVRHRHPHAQYETPQQPRQARHGRPWRLWVIALVVLAVAAVLGAMLSLVFAGANVDVTPRSATVTLPASLQAALNAPVGTLSYQQASVSLNATTTVPAGGSEQVQRAASGALTISNLYSTTPQRLIANTRFQAPDGKIYRIHDSVVVPGMQSGKAGTATATVYADSPGPDYNRSGTTIYTIPGFKGRAQYAKITALSGPVTGGFVGTQPSVSQSDLSAAKSAMETQLDAAVRKQIAGNLPPGYQVIAGTLSVTFGTIAQTGAGGGQAALSESATAQADVVRTADIAAAVAKQTVQGYQGEAVSFAAPGALNPTASTSGQGSSLVIQLGGGTATLVWQFDPGALKAALVGQPKSQFEAIIRQFEPAVAKADASLRPFWAGAFPSDPGKISVTVEEAK
jgi:hypothetical protein